jgi:D-alanyl-D-alanine carboxypeptidase
MQKSSCCNLRFFSSHVFVGLMLIFCLAISACGSSTGTQATAPNALGQRLQPLVEAQMKAMQVPGAAIFVQGAGSQSWAANLGTSNLATHAPMSPDMHFRIGSITKTFVGTVILQLVDEGKIKLDDPISKYQPEVPNGNNITVREVLNMSSGLYSYSDDDGFGKIMDAELYGNNMNRVWEPKELLAIAFKHPPYFAPGKGFHYSNTNYILLGLMIEQLTGHAVEDEIQHRILTPLGMNNTSMPQITSSAIPNPYPRGYTFVTPATQTGQSGGKSKNNSPDATNPLDVTMVNPSWGWTAGNMISTAHDLQIWAKVLVTGKLLSAATQKERLSWLAIPGVSPTYPLKYGLAIADFDGFIGHNGGLPGFQSFMGYMPEKSEMIVILTNLQPTANNAGPADELAKTIQKNLT